MRAVIGAVVMGAYAPILLFIAPLLVGAMVTRMGFTPAQGGWAISAHLGGIGLAGIPCAVLVRRRIWRRLLTGGVLAMAALFAAAGAAHSFPAVIACLFAAGVAGGVVVSIALPTLGMAARPGAAFAFWVVAQLALGAAAVAALPAILALGGLALTYGVLAALTLLTLPLVLVMPEGPSEAEATQGERFRLDAAAAWSVVGLIGLFAFYCAIGGVWSFLERIGDAAGVAGPVIAATLSAATLAGVCGALAAAAIPPSRGELAPIIAGLALLLVAVWLLRGLADVATFVTASLIFKVAWTFTLPFFLTCLARIGRPEALLVLANITIGAGLAAGPAVAAGLIGQGGYERVVCMGLIGLSIAACAFVTLASRQRIAARRRAGLPQDASPHETNKEATA